MRVKTPPWSPRRATHKEARAPRPDQADLRGIEPRGWTYARERSWQRRQPGSLADHCDTHTDLHVKHKLYLGHRAPRAYCMSIRTDFSSHVS